MYTNDFRSESEVISDYLSNYRNISKDDIQTSYKNIKGNMLFCIRIKDTIGMDTLKTYSVSKRGLYQ